MDFDQLPTFFEGQSRIIKSTPQANILLCKLKPTVFSLQAKGSIIVPGIDRVRVRLNALLSTVLHTGGVRTSTLETQDDTIFMEKQDVAPIEVVVKAALVGSPKHLYQNIDQTPTRFSQKLEKRHTPYVRFDWRNPLPLDDQCMPVGLADYFIDTKRANDTALLAFHILQNHFRAHQLDLIDICFFMNTSGDVICGEVSTDNCRLDYLGDDEEIRHLFQSKEKNMALPRAQTILSLLETL